MGEAEEEVTRTPTPTPTSTRDAGAQQQQQQDDDPTSAPASAAAALAGAAAASRPAWQWEESADATAAYGALLSVLLAGRALGPLATAAAASSSSAGAGAGAGVGPWLDLPYFVALAAATVYVGAHRGLTSRQRQQMSLREGALAPVVASAALFGVYLLLRFLPDLNIRTLLSGYFFLLTTGATLSAAVPTLRRIGGGAAAAAAAAAAAGPALPGGGVGGGVGGGGGDGGGGGGLGLGLGLGLGVPSVRVPLPSGLVLDDAGEPVEAATLAPTDFAAAAVAVAVAALGAHAWAQPLSGGSSLVDYSLNNLAACLIAADILQLVGLRSFRAAALLLVGLLIYDVTWVFASPHFSPGGENVMLTVATSDQIVGPTRLLFPRAGGAATAAAAMREGAAFPFSLLGLGDVAVPGLLACLALRFDASRAVDMPRRAAAALAAMRAALEEMDPALASAEELGAAGSRAASEAYERVAEAEERAAAAAAGATPAAAGPPPAASADAALAAVVVGPSETVLQQRPYFSAVLAAHAAGLLAAFAANGVTGLGQPALLYIVPATLGAVAATAASRGELRKVWEWTDVPSFGPAQAFLEREREEKETKRRDEAKAAAAAAAKR